MEIDHLMIPVPGPDTATAKLPYGRKGTKTTKLSCATATVASEERILRPFSEADLIEAGKICRVSGPPFV
jgi:hypothetical protein